MVTEEAQINALPFMVELIVTEPDVQINASP